MNRKDYIEEAMYLLRAGYVRHDRHDASVICPQCGGEVLLIGFYKMEGWSWSREFAVCQECDNVTEV